MSFVVDVTVKSVIVDSRVLSHLVLQQPEGTESFYKIRTGDDAIESLDMSLEPSNASETTIPFNPIGYQMKISSATERISLELYFKQSLTKEVTLIASTSFVVSLVLGGGTDATVTRLFSPESKIQGSVTFLLALGLSEASSTTGIFKKVSSGTVTRFPSPTLNRGRSMTSVPAKMVKPNFKFWNKPKKVKFGSKLDPNSTTVPHVILQTIECIKERGMELPGIFRESAPAAVVQDTIKKYEGGKEIIWRDIANQHVVAGVLMAFLLQLPEPLIPFDLYESFMAAQETVTDRDDRAKFVSKLIKTLPIANGKILFFLFSFLNGLSVLSTVNKMDAHNLGIVFGPALLRKQEENVKQIIADSPAVINSIKLLIEENKFFFEDGPLLGEAYFLTDIEATPKATSTFVSIHPEMHKKIVNSEKEFFVFQDQMTNNLALITRNIGQLLKELQSPDNYTPVDIQALSSLVHSFHTIMDNPYLYTSDLKKQVISVRIASNVVGQCKTLQFAMRGVQERLLGLESTVESSAFAEHDEYIEATLIFSAALIKIKGELDSAQSAMISRHGTSVDVHLTTVRTVIRTISENIRIQCTNKLRNELVQANSVGRAVAVARLLSCVLGALQSESLEELDSSVVKVIAPPAVNQADRKRLDALIEVMDLAFEQFDKALCGIQSGVDSIFSVIDSRSLVQLLVGIKKYINKYLDSDAVVKTIATENAQKIATEDGPLTKARLRATLIMDEFRTLLNSIMIEIDSISTYSDAHSLVSLGERCRMIAKIPEDITNKRGTNTRTKTNRSQRQTVHGQIFLLQSMCNESFDIIRGYMFQTNQEIQKCHNTEELNKITKTLTQLNSFLRERIEM